ncbi:MAG: hypothetical protein JST54_23280 [Deltaproteobacteria bacterium]|nr:hypothetical protein [Deltaproteobacteria bacterium]
MSDDKKHERFAHLERERAAPLRESVVPGAADRFGSEPPAAVEREPAPLIPKPTPTAARFDVPTGPDQLDLEKASDDEQPFVVCAGCGTESGKFAQFCPTCGASFDTPQQREHNARVWAGRKAQLQADRDSAHARQDALLEDAKQQAAVRHNQAVAMAEEVKQAYERDGALASQNKRPWIQREAGGSGSPLLTLLSGLPEPWNWVVGGVTTLVPLAMVAVARTHSTAWDIGAAWLGIDFLLLLPREFWRPRRRTWWDDF